MKKKYFKILLNCVRFEHFNFCFLGSVACSDQHNVWFGMAYKHKRYGMYYHNSAPCFSDKAWILHVMSQNADVLNLFS